MRFFIFQVIRFFASHFREDKIWLRRTRPNKRDYQVVIAVDDSRSMSESRCGGVAIEALVTVCRAMSQLEVGVLAVASFGQKGNIRLLHDFDQPFTGEAGIKVGSSSCSHFHSAQNYKVLTIVLLLAVYACICCWCICFVVLTSVSLMFFYWGTDDLEFDI